MCADEELQVNWPKLNRLPWALESQAEALTNAQKNPVVGPLVGTAIRRHERGKSDARLAFAEEGVYKKRIE